MHEHERAVHISPHIAKPPPGPFPLTGSTIEKAVSAEAIREMKEHLFDHLEAPDPTGELVDSIRKIAERHGLIPVIGPPHMRDLRYVQVKGEFIAPGDVKVSVEPCAAPEGQPTFLDIPFMTTLERVEMLNRLNRILQDAPYVGPAPVGPSKVSLEPGALNYASGPGFGCFACEGFHQKAPDFDAIPALRAAHDATVEHDRNMEKMLRAEIEEARAGVETARTALYDYLKSKNRAA